MPAITPTDLPNTTLFGHDAKGNLCFFNVGEDGKIISARNPTPEEIMEFNRLVGTVELKRQVEELKRKLDNIQGR
jgi:hypothetical protein